jgi:hypothetical protein
MKAAKEGHRTATRRDDGRGGISVTMAVVSLVAVVAIVGAAGYVGLSAFGSGGTSTTSKSCYPPTAPQCAGQGNLNDSAGVVVHQPGYDLSKVSIASI